jgi:hypothetical protein
MVRIRPTARAFGALLWRRREWFLVPVFFALVVAAVYRDIWWQGESGVGWDLIESYWPDLAFFARELSHGNFPLWNPHERGGVPAHADPQTALFYPVQWALAAWAVAVDHGQVSWSLIQFKELLHHGLGGTLVYLYTRTRKLPWQAASVAGLAVVLAESWVQLKSNNFLQAVAWTPLVWIATDAFFARPDARRAVALAASLYLPASVGSPPGYFYVLLAAGSYGLLRAGAFIWTEVHGPDPGEAAAPRSPSRPTPARVLLRTAGALLLAVALVAATQAVLFVPVRDLLALSPRAEHGLDFALQGNSGWAKTWPALVAPLHDTYTVHCGLLTPVLGALALLARPRRDGGAPLFFAGFAAAMIVMSFGTEAPLLPWLVLHAPGFALFRIAARYLVLAPLALGVLAAHGMAILLEARTRQRGRLALLLAIGAFTIVGTRWLRGFEPTLIFDPHFPNLPLYGAAALAGFILLVALVPRRWAPGLAGAGVFLFFGYGAHLVGRQMGYQPRPDHLEDLGKLGGLYDLDRYRVYDEFLLEQRAGSRLGLREFRGYPSEDPLSRLDYIQILAAATSPEGMPLLGEYNIRYVFYGPHTTKGWSRKRLPNAPDIGAPKRFKAVSPAISETRFPAPMAAWYGGLRRVDHDDVLHALQGARDDDGVRRIAILTTAGAPAALEPRLQPLLAAEKSAPPAVAGLVRRLQTENVDLEIEAPAPGLVVLNEFMFKGWRVFVDGREEIPMQVDLALRGVLVESGKHRIAWVYRPPHFTGLIALWALGLAAFGWAAGGARGDRWARALGSRLRSRIQRQTA